jgi:hypothetical protein
MRRSQTMIVVLGFLTLVACNKGKDDKAEVPAAKAQDNPKAVAGEPPPVTAGAGADVGVSAGGIQRDPQEGAAAVVTAANGTIEVRRVGEATYAPVAAKDKLYSGDTIRTADKATATLALPDESVIEVAETSTVGIGSRNTTADPASSAAVLSGLARFTVSPRAPGEGAFRVYTAAGVIVTTGTTYGVGVAASGEARVGVETGNVEVIGLAALDAKPVIVDGGAAASIAASGTVAAPAPWPQDDWGAWRDSVDAKLEAQSAIDAHASALVELDTQLKDAYVDLDATADTVATFEASAATSAEKGDAAAYTASLPDGAATIDASFALAGRVEALTWAYASHATLASDIYVRTPSVKFEVIAPRVDTAVLWPKRFEITAVGYLEPLRMQYYVHHPRGRMHAELVGIAVPEFYAQVEPPQIDPVRVRSRVKATIWIAPDITYRASSRIVWIGAPAFDWSTNVRVSAAPFRAKVAWYVQPPTLKAKLLVGVPVTGKFSTRLAVGAPVARASLAAAWKVPVGVKVRIGAPDLKLAANARAKIKLDANGRLVHQASARVTAPDVKATVKVKAPDVRGKVGVDVVAPAVKIGGGVKAKVNTGVDVGAKLGGGVKAKVDTGVKAKVTVPAVKVNVPKPPAVKVKGKVDVKAGFKVGG